jgi:hypothetical protein
MTRRPLYSAALLVAACGSLALALNAPRQADRPRPVPLAAVRVLPGVLPGGEVRLPNQWSLRPAGKQILLGDFPVNMALHPSGGWLAILHAGFGPHEIIVVDIRQGNQRVCCRVPIRQTFYGLCFAPDGNTLFASGGEYEVIHSYRFEEGLLGQPRKLRVASEKSKFIPAGLAVDKEGRTLFVAGTWGHAVCLLPLDAPTSVTRSRSSRTATPTPAFPSRAASACSSACGARPALPSSTCGSGG